MWSVTPADMNGNREMSNDAAERKAGNIGNPPAGVSGYARLLLSLAVLAVIWLLVLPALKQVPWLGQRAQHLEDAGIETDAMFYTELNWDPPTGAHFP